MGKDYSETANYKIWQLNRKKENATDEVKIKIDLAINLIKLRTKKKLSQIELSKELKVNQKNISQWEKGKYRRGTISEILHNFHDLDRQ